MRTITTNQLQPKTVIQVQGKVNYCRMLRKIEGDELAKVNEQRNAKGLTAIDKPYTTITISEPNVMCVLGTQEERNLATWVQESCYQNKSTNTMCLSHDNKGREPMFLKRSSVTATDLQQFGPTGELATGLDVTLVFEVYAAKPFNGVGLQAIIVNEPEVKYYGGNSANNALAALGLTFTPASAEELSFAAKQRKMMQEIALDLSQQSEQDIPNAMPQQQVAEIVMPQQPTEQAIPNAMPQQQIAGIVMPQQPTEQAIPNAMPQQQMTGIVMPQYTEALPPFTQQQMATNTNRNY